MQTVAAIAAVTGWSLESLLEMEAVELAEWRDALPERIQ
nr:GpE family phage tail protein [Azonexus hydrophilus]